MNDEQRTQYLRRMQNAMRPMTPEEIADMQRRQAPLMRNSQDSLRGAAGMQNFWAADPNDGHWLPDRPKPAFWQRLKRLLRIA